MGNLKKFLLGIILVVLVSVFAIKPLISPGYFSVHDNTQVQRVYEMGKSLSDGMFPVRWVSDLGYGYGYPIFNFYAPLAYYFGGYLTILGFNALIATKIMIATGVLLSGIFMYVLARQFWGDMGGFVSAIFYVYAPYHALNIFVRGDVGEVWAYAFFPLVFYSLYKIYKEGKWRYAMLGGLSYALIILSHNLSAFIITPFMIVASILAAFTLYKNKQAYIIFRIIAVFVLGILISAFYWLPAILELKYTNIGSILGSGSNFRDNFVCLKQLWSSPWGFGGSNPGCVDGISFKLGKLHVLGVLLAAVLFVWTGIKNKKWNKTLLVLFLGLVLSVFMTNQISKPLWDAIKSMEFIQFPWRYLGIAAFFTSLITGSIFFNNEKLFKSNYISLVIAAVISLALIINSFKIFQPQRVLLYPNSYYISDENLKWTTSKISDEYLPKNFIKLTDEIQIKDNLFSDPNLSVTLDKTQVEKLDVNGLSLGGDGVFGKAWFPAWQAKVDGKSTPVKNSNGRVSVYIPPGRHILVLNFVQTPVEKLSNLLTLIGFVGIVTVIILSISERNMNEKKS